MLHFNYKQGGVLAHSSCYNRIPQIGWLISNINLFLPILEAVKSKIKLPTDLVSGENLLPCTQTVIYLLFPRMVEGTREFSEVSFIRTLIPLMRVCIICSLRSPAIEEGYDTAVKLLWCPAFLLSLPILKLWTSSHRSRESITCWEVSSGRVS